MLTRLISTIRPLSLTTTTSLRLFNTSVVRRVGDGDHTRSKAKEKAAHDLKTRKEKRWLDTVASDSEAIIKGESQHAKKVENPKKDIDKLQNDTIEAVREKEEKGHLPKHDVGRRDTHEERVHGSTAKPTSQKKKS